MLQVLSNRVFRRLFIAQIATLLGTGIATVALAILAFDLAGDNAGRVLGTALAVKMIAYVAVAPIASAFASVLPRRATLVGLELWRAAMIALLPFVTEIWQVYLIIFALQAGSAAFTPAFQAIIPEILPDEDDYTNALSLSRLAYDLEALVSPFLAALLLGYIASNLLFGITAIGFILSAALILSVTLPVALNAQRRGIYDRTTRGLRIYLATPRLRGLMAVNMAVAAVGAIVFVNTVVYVQGAYGLNKQATAFALTCFGFGSMLAALTLPAVLKRRPDRDVMLAAVFLLGLVGIATAFVPNYQTLLAAWFAAGFGYAAALVPGGRLLRRSARPDDRPALFAAQFALSHFCWLITYPLAGYLGSVMGLSITAFIMGLLATTAAVAALIIWPRNDSLELEHSHDDLPPDHPHLRHGHERQGHSHRHAFVIDDLHPHWPGRQG